MRGKAAENTEELIKLMRRWQELEDSTVAHTTKVIEKTSNPFLKLLMEIIRQDSTMHKRVQQVILDSLEKQALSLTPEELGELWDEIEDARRDGEGNPRARRDGEEELPAVHAAAPAELPDRGREEARPDSVATGGLQAGALPVRLIPFSR